MRVRLALAAALASAATLGGTPASAQTCFGTTNLMRACVHPETLPTVDPTGNCYEDCVWVGLPECVPVTVPLPAVSGGSGGELVTFHCGMLVIALIC